MKVYTYLLWQHQKAGALERGYRFFAFIINKTDQLIFKTLQSVNIILTACVLLNRAI